MIAWTAILSMLHVGFALEASQGIGKLPLPASNAPKNSAVRMFKVEPPTYPPEAVNAGLEGRVLLRLRITAEGNVAEVQIQESSGHKILDDAAVRYAMTARFIPARRDGMAVEVIALHPIRFALTDK